MTLDEAIKHCEEVAEKYEKSLKAYENTDEDRPLFSEEETKCRLCAEEHWQLATWLRELKAYRNKSQERDDESCNEIWEKAYAERDGKKMNGSFEFTLNNPLTKEDWDKIADVELENTPSVTFKTPKGKQVKYIKSDVLDKIKAEIAELQLIGYATVDGKREIASRAVMQIIDKYRAESEE